MLDTRGKFSGNSSIKTYRLKEDRVGSSRSDFKEDDVVLVQELSSSKPIDPNSWVKAKIIGVDDFYKIKRSVYVFEQI